MDIQSKLLAFAGLHEVAELLDLNDEYEKQNELAAYCRSVGKPFLVKTYFRHLLNCEACGIMTAEAQLHFEVPSQPLEEAASPPDFTSPSGYFYAIKLSTLHGILTHGKPMPKKLQELLSRVRT